MKNKIKNIVLLEISFFIYSLSAMCLKNSTYNTSEIIHIIIFFGLGVLLLGVYAILWQQVLKKMPLNIAFSNKGITIVWGIIWGRIIFNENINLGMIIGALLVVLGIVLIMYKKEVN